MDNGSAYFLQNYCIQLTAAVLTFIRESIKKAPSILARQGRFILAVLFALLKVAPKPFRLPKARQLQQQVAILLEN